MSGRYHIHTHPAPPPPGGYPARFFREDGATYIKYGHPVFHGTSQRGDDYWTAEIITQTWHQAETGRLPSSGAGYGGKFAGDGFDGIWLDMSEIVRPTRDGIHRRETISTRVDLGVSVTGLRFDKSGALTTPLPPYLTLPIPVVFNPIPMSLPGRGALVATAQAAAQLGNLAVIDPSDFHDDLGNFAGVLAARISGKSFAAIPVSWTPHYLEIDDPKADVPMLAEEIQARWPSAVLGARLGLAGDAASRSPCQCHGTARAFHLAVSDSR
jgi:hypothetical protein